MSSVFFFYLKTISFVYFDIDIYKYYILFRLFMLIYFGGKKYDVKICSDPMGRV